MLDEIDKFKIKETVTRINSGIINEDDMSLLLIRLREISDVNSVVRELAHFIAHPKRDSGHVFSSLYDFYCNFRTLTEITVLKRPINLEKPIEKWFFHFVILQLKQHDPQKLQKKLGYGYKKAKNIFKNSFDYIDDQYHKNVMSTDEIKKIISASTTVINVNALFKVNDIIESIIELLEEENLISNVIEFKRQRDSIILALFTLLHNRRFEIDGDVFGKIQISLDFSAPDNKMFLQLNGSIKLPNGMEISHALIETDLEFTKYCDKNLLITKNIGNENHTCRAFDDTALLTLKKVDGNNILSRLSDQN